MTVPAIRISTTTKRKLAGLKSSDETYDDLINKLLLLVPEDDDVGRYANAFRQGLIRARLDLKEGRLVTHEVVKRRLGL
jgi:hypothetical protein